MFVIIRSFVLKMNSSECLNRLYFGGFLSKYLRSKEFEVMFLYCLNHISRSKIVVCEVDTRHFRLQGLEVP